MDLMNGIDVFNEDNLARSPTSKSKAQSWKVLKQNVPKGSPQKKARKKCLLNPPDPVPKFGSKGQLFDDGKHSHNQVDPSEHFLEWEKPAVNVMIIKKIMENDVTQQFKELCRWLMEERKMVVFVEDALAAEPSITEDDTFALLREKIINFEDGDQLENKIDFVICLGGDGTLLYASALFQESCPPVMAFHLGSLGFLTSFKFEHFKKEITRVLDGRAALTLRSRLRCVISKDMENERVTQQQFTVLNEVVIDRGPSSYLCNLDIYCNDNHITTVQGDGVIISTPTGSTAYAVAAGASMVHPSVPAILITPICPHSLSFRPIILPAGVEIEIVVNEDSRNTAWASFDGRNRTELRQGNSVQLTTSIYPVPSVNYENQTCDWFKSLGECLHWNVRERQRNYSSADSM